MIHFNGKEKGKPGRKGVTYAQYKEAFDAIVSEGENLCPSSKEMRLKLGGCSEERLCAFKRRYQDEKAAEITKKFELPPELEEAIARAIFERANRETEVLAAELASNRLDLDSLVARISDLKTKNRSLENQKLEMQLANSRLQGLLEHLRAEKEQLRASLDAQQQKVLDLTAEISAERVRDEVHGGLYRLTAANAVGLIS